MGGCGQSRGQPNPQLMPVQLRRRPTILMQKGGSTMRFARACGGLAAVFGVGIALALCCEQLAALLDAALMI